jgi:ferric-dicitrate binding protein FerR (iron transport regulator)
VSGAEKARSDEEGAANLASISRSLDGEVSEAEHAAGRERLMVSFGTTTRFRMWRPLAAAAIVVSLAAVLAVLLIGRPGRIDYRVSGPVVTEGGWLGVPNDRGALSLRFSEGTEIDLGPGSKGRVAEVTPEGARVVLATGILRARVVHQPRARWTVVAGPYAIEVTGTAFDVGWSTQGERLELSLHDGSVIVRGPSLRDGIRVGAGQRLVAHARTGGAELSSLFAPEAAQESPPEAPSATEPEPSEREREPIEASPAAPALPTWSEMLASGNFRGVLAAAQARGIDATLNHGTIGDLVALADAARYAHDKNLAKRGLLAERARFPRSAEARAAAFVLGRMADDGGLSAEALRWYDDYLTESPHGAFAAEALGRKLVALVRSGDAGAARVVAKGYLERFPRGAHAAYAREVLPNP